MVEPVTVTRVTSVLVRSWCQPREVTELMAIPWFPEPVARLKLGGIWELADIERIAAETGLTLNYEALDDLSASNDDGGTTPRPAGSSPGRARAAT